MEESKSFLEIIKSRGFAWLFLAFLILDLIILFTMKEFRAYWTLLGTESFALLGYLAVQALKGRDEEVFFWKLFKKSE